jgi:hypothetical protein
MIVLVIVIGAFLLWNFNIKNTGSENLDDNKNIVFKSPNCGCCTLYVPYLNKNGFEVETKNENMIHIRKKYQVPNAMESCHTTIIGDYFIEGHVPVEAINKLLEEKPDIRGISLPGMPSGSPGMPGQKSGSFIIYAISKWNNSKYAKNKNRYVKSKIELCS